MPGYVTQLAAVFFAGVGMTLAGGLGLALRRASWWARAAAVLLACGGAAVGAAVCVDDWVPAGGAAVVTAAGAAACLVAGSRVVTRPGVCWAALALGGVATAVGSVVAYDAQDAAELDQQVADLNLLDAPPPSRSPANARATTDRGTPVPLMEATTPRTAEALREVEERFLRDTPSRAHLVRRRPPDDTTNCHGWIFTGGRFWVGGASVDSILDENGYRTVGVPQPGDLAVYRSGSTVLHTAVVRDVTAGLSVLVESKWGCAGVFLHPVNQSIYGAAFTYYRSARPGHVLAGITGAPAN